MHIDVVHALLPAARFPQKTEFFSPLVAINFVQLFQQEASGVPPLSLLEF